MSFSVLLPTPHIFIFLMRSWARFCPGGMYVLVSCEVSQERVESNRKTSMAPRLQRKIEDTPIVFGKLL